MRDGGLVVSGGNKVAGEGHLSGAGSQHPKRGVGEAGASLVEFALLAPLLFAILLGTITAGLALSEKNSMTNAVREGGRLGATLPEGTGWSTDWAVEVKDRVVALSDLEEKEVCAQVIDVTPTPDTVEGSYIGSACPLSEAPPTPSSATKGCIVKVWARTSAELNTIFFSRSLTLDANAVGIYERSGECP